MHSKIVYEKLKKGFREIFSNVTKKDLFLIAIFPIILTIILLLPQAIQELLRLNIQSPSWWQFFTSSFVHKNYTHYINNLSLFLILMITNFIIILKTDSKNKFYILYFATLIMVPLVSSFVSYNFIPQLKSTQGSSDIVAAVFGFLPITLIRFFHSLNKKIDNERMFYAVLFYSLLFLLFVYKGFSFFFIIFLFCYFIYIIVLRKQFVYIGGIYIKFRKKLFQFVLLFATIIFLVGLSLIFPTNILLDETLVNIGGHYVGFLMGIILANLLLR
jgi:hypothetical protein